MRIFVYLGCRLRPLRSRSGTHRRRTFDVSDINIIGRITYGGRGVWLLQPLELNSGLNRRCRCSSSADGLIRLTRERSGCCRLSFRDTASRHLHPLLMLRHGFARRLVFRRGFRNGLRRETKKAPFATWRPQSKLSRHWTRSRRRSDPSRGPSFRLPFCWRQQ